MKKQAIMVAIVLLVCPAVWCSADDDWPVSPFKYEFNVSWGGVPLVDWATFTDFYIGDHDYYIGYPDSASQLYADYAGPTYSTGVISADFNIQFRRWFALGTQINFDGIFGSRCSPYTGERLGSRNGLVVSVLPYARFTYLNHRYIKLYSAIGLGLTAGYRNYTYGYEANIYPAFQITPIGMTVGNKVYGLIECGLGTVFIGYRFGVGFRF